MQMRRLAFLWIGILLVALCQEEDEHIEQDHPEDDEDEHHDEADNNEEHRDQPKDEEVPIPWVPLSQGPPEIKEPVEEDLSSDQVHRIFKKIDDDLDGKLSMTELLEFGQRTRRQIAEKQAKVLLEDIDTNSDQKASLEELPQIRRWLVDNGYAEDEGHDREEDAQVDPKRFRAADRDKNGGLDRFELPGLLYPEMDEDVLHVHTQERLRKLDKDNDGQLTEDEFFSGVEGRYQDDEAMEKMSADFNKLDRNHNGQINIGEMHLWESGTFQAEEAMKHLFEVGDKNADKGITLEELDRAREKIWSTPTSRHIRSWCDHYEL